jgi:hypothetical protein
MTDTAALESGRRNAVASLTAFLVLGILGGVVVGWVFPAVFGIEWLCLFAGPATPAADRYVVVAATAGVVSWIGAGCLALMTYSPARPRLPVWVAVVWFTFYVVAGFMGATVTGAQPCQDTGGSWIL